MRLRRIFFGIVAAIVALVVLAGVTLGVLLWRFDPNAYKGRIEASVQDATGYEVALDGPIGLAWALRPTITLSDVVVKNPPGFTSPDLARIGKLALRLDLPALIGGQVVVDSLTVQHPQVMLERNKAGAANWLPPKRPARSAAAPPTTGTAKSPKPLPFAVHEVRIRNLDLRYRDGRTGAAYAGTLKRLDLSAPSPQAAVKLLASGTANGHAFELRAQAPSWRQLLAGGPPIPLTANLHVTGPDEDLTVNVAAPVPDHPVHFVLSGKYRTDPVKLTADIGGQGLPIGPDAKLPLKLNAEAAGSSLAIVGAVGDPARLSGVDFAVTAASADLAKLGGLFGMRLPDLHALKLSGRITDTGGLRNGFAVSGLKLASKEEDIAGSLEVALAPHRALTANLHGTRLDLAAFRTPASPSAKPAPAPPARPTSAHLISDAPLPLGALRGETADVTLRFDTVQAEDQTFHDVRGEAHLHGGVLTAKLHGVFAGGAADLDTTVDVRGVKPAIALTLNAPALPAGQLLGALGEPRLLDGKLAVEAKLHGSGATPHLIAASLDGTARLSMQGGTVDTQLIQRTLGPAIARANPLALLGHGGATRLRCLAVRANAAGGRVKLDPLLLSSDLVTVSGSGTVDLASETLDLHLRPEGKVGSVGFSVPVTLSGPLRAPHADVVKGAPASAVLGLLSGTVLAPNGSGPTCAGALAAVNGKAPPPRSAAAASAPKAKPKRPNPAELLRQLFR